LYHSTTIKEGYTPVIHCKSISQAARITSIDSKQIRTGDRAIVEFEFLYRPEHIRSGQRIIFREGRTKGIGIVNSILDDLK
ncbi:MAG: elongation factor 1-alpha, partial [Candidatus Heimdallarchaeota archaeon]|nr:elongation factor 1-alpha [Candidatus Heimdallarchaeota archaeon]